MVIKTRERHKHVLHQDTLSWKIKSMSSEQCTLNMDELSLANQINGDRWFDLTDRENPEFVYTL